LRSALRGVTLSGTSTLIPLASIPRCVVRHRRYKLVGGAVTGPFFDLDRDERTALDKAVTDCVAHPAILAAHFVKSKTVRRVSPGDGCHGVILARRGDGPIC
jgi:hypothetical protein